MEWLRWVITVVVIGLAFWAGDDRGYQRRSTEALTADLGRAQQALAAKDQQLLDAANRARADVASRDELAEALARIEGRFGGLGRQLQGALTNANLAVCVYPDAVRGVRQQSRAEVAAAAERARAAAAGSDPPG